MLVLAGPLFFVTAVTLSRCNFWVPLSDLQIEVYLMEILALEVFREQVLRSKPLISLPPLVAELI